MKSVLRTFDESKYNLTNRRILVTGGTGSFGRAFVAHVLKTQKPERLIIFSRDELKQYEMAQEFPESEYPEIRYFIGDVRDIDRLEMAMRDTEIVIHAAAMKHVSAAEYNPFECIHTNVLGAENLVKAALRCGVEKVLALSTDKAVNPANLYGASKLASDKIFIAANRLAGVDGTRFAIVRYGNVVGSRGSVVPFFQKLLANGAASLPVTDERMTRFWITLPQAVDFVIQSFTDMTGGELYVPRIPSMKVTDLAEAIAPGADMIEIGVRPGEKLHEEMISTEDSRRTIMQEGRYVVLPTLAEWGFTDPEGEQVPDGFSYSSNTNDLWLSVEGIRELMAQLEL